MSRAPVDARTARGACSPGVHPLMRGDSERNVHIETADGRRQRVDVCFLFSGSSRVIVRVGGPVSGGCCREWTGKERGEKREWRCKARLCGVWSKVAHPIGRIRLISADGLCNNRRAEVTSRPTLLSPPPRRSPNRQRVYMRFRGNQEDLTR